MSTINNTATATARTNATRPADAEWDALRKGARLGYPAVNGGMVTQGHADYCVEYGHAVHVEDGEESPWCPRCGDARVEETTEESAEGVDYIVCESCAPYIVGGADLEDHAAYYGDDETHRNLSTFITDHGMIAHGGPVDMGGYYDCEACRMVCIGDAQRVYLID